MSVATYRPALDAAELSAAAAALRLASDAARERAAYVPTSRVALVSTGFRGVAADAAYARLDAFGSVFARGADDLATAASLVAAAAGLQRQLDEAAMFATRYLHSRTVLWLNAMSMALDLELARSLLRLGGHEQDYDPLFAHPDESFQDLHARHVPTLPAATRAAVEAAGGTVLEAGPASTTVVVGDVVDPARVITMVAGATTGAPAKLEGELAKASRLAQQTGAAVVVWQGYAPPRSVPRAVSPLRASAGADDLAMFQAALEERFPDAQKTVVSHSYGTLLATTAARDHGLIADDLWVLGSAGVAGQHVSELTLADEHATVHVVDSPQDPILLLRSGPSAVLGASPSYVGWGAQRVEGVRGGHSDYFTDPAFVSALQQRASTT